MLNCKNLALIDLSHNYLVDLNYDFADFHALKSIYLHVNYIADFNVNIFSYFIFLFFISFIYLFFSKIFVFIYFFWQENPLFIRIFIIILGFEENQMPEYELADHPWKPIRNCR
jgi:hypothetical protein